MWRWIFLSFRPFSIALGLFIVLNLVLTLQELRFSASRIWLDAPLPEPWLSIFALILGSSLLIPHSGSRRHNLRYLQIGVLSGFLLLAGSNVLGFYHLVRAEKISSRAAFPFSLIISLLLLVEIVRLGFWQPIQLRMPRPARRFFGLLLVLGAYCLLMMAHIYSFGMTDYSPAVDRADAIVVLGAKVYPDGRLSDVLRHRMDTAIELFKRSKAPYLLHSGGIDAHGVSEVECMKRYAVAHGVPEDRNLLDDQGKNTYMSAVNCARIARAKGFQRFFVVSQYYHLARAKLSFEREGAPCYTVPALSQDKKGLEKETFMLVREIFAFPFYLLFRK